MCVFFWRNLRENYLKKHFFLVKSIDLEIFPLRKSSIRFINSGERRCWFISTKENLFLFGKATVHFGVKIILKIFTWLAKKRVGVIWKQILFWVVKTIYFGVRIILNVRKAAPIIRIRMVHSWKYLTFLISSITHAIVQIPLQEISLKWMFTFYFNDKLTFISKMRF